MPRLIQVIESETTRGEGISGDPCRRVMQYYSTDGLILAEHDEWVELHRPVNPAGKVQE